MFLNSTPVDWTQLWEYAVVGLQATLLCRMALDDDNSSVLAAAAEALHALLGPSVSEDFVAEVADGCSGLGWPLPCMGVLRRAHPAGTWEAAADMAAQEVGGSVCLVWRAGY